MTIKIKTAINFLSKFYIEERSKAAVFIFQMTLNKKLFHHTFKQLKIQLTLAVIYTQHQLLLGYYSCIRSLQVQNR